MRIHDGNGINILNIASRLSSREKLSNGEHKCLPRAAGSPPIAESQAYVRVLSITLRRDSRITADDPALLTFSADLARTNTESSTDAQESDIATKTFPFPVNGDA